MFDQFLLSSPKPPFPSSRVFVYFSPKGFTDCVDAIAMSSTSILETAKPFSPFFADQSLRKPALEPPQPVGLGVADGLKAEPTRPARTTAMMTGESSREKARARTLSTERWRPIRVNSWEHLRIHGLTSGNWDFGDSIPEHHGLHVHKLGDTVNNSNPMGVAVNSMWIGLCVFAGKALYKVLES
ncbi:protein MARD1 [Iris pallida]|uniref:Protein MARD1 n=1 Tax=Iris pallida TaxID=29817 RepID=A0AAX6FY79_IRIPA|nr:protein MARD1 [Iris pallida]